MNCVASIASVGVPVILPSRCASLAGLHPKIRPAGSSLLISQVATSPRPEMVGNCTAISSLKVRVNVSEGYVMVNGKSRIVSSASQIPSPSSSPGTLFWSVMSVPQVASIVSNQVSLSSSRSSTRGGVLVDSPFKVSGIPSPSLSMEPAESNGNASGPTEQPPLAGTSGPSQTPSPSLSAFDESVPVLFWST